MKIEMVWWFFIKFPSIELQSDYPFSRWFIQWKMIIFHITVDVHELTLFLPPCFPPDNDWNTSQNLLSGGHFTCFCWIKFKTWPGFTSKESQAAVVFLPCDFGCFSEIALHQIYSWLRPLSQWQLWLIDRQMRMHETWAVVPEIHHQAS